MAQRTPGARKRRSSCSLSREAAENTDDRQNGRDQLASVHVGMQQAELADANDDDAEDGYGAPASRASTRAAAGASAQQQQLHRDIGALLPSDLDEQRLRQVWRAAPTRHQQDKDALLQQYRRQFVRWRFQLRQRCSLLFYGLGSKRQLLEAFAEEALDDAGVLAFYGHQPDLNAKQVMAAVAAALTHQSHKGVGHMELLNAIHGEARHAAARRVYVLLHNIDGPGFRPPEEQLWLSRLARCPNVHLLASVDHTNAALLWDPAACARFRWLWHDVTTFEPYAAETADAPPLLVGCFQAAAKRSAATVLHSLVAAAREVFKLLAEWQLDDPGAGGVAFAQLYRMARERFVVSSEHALRSHLAEFRDHELVKLRPGPDGGELLYVPMDEDVLRRVLRDMEEGGGTAVEGGAG